MFIKKGDKVIILKGASAGKTGNVLKVFPKEGKVIVEGANLRKKHQRSRKAEGKGQIIDIAAPIRVSNVALLDPKTNKPTRVGYKIVSGKKVRISAKSKQEI